MKQGQGCEARWISIFLRLTIALLFGVMSSAKFIYGLDKTVEYFIILFEPTWLPLPLVKIFATLIPYMEVVIAVWLITGIALKAAWIFTCIVMLLLAFGMTVAKGYNSPANNYIYMLFCLAGLYFSQFDFCNKEKR